MIERVIETLTPPEHWIKGSYARTDKGKAIGPYTPGACSWCLEGAVWRHDPETPDNHFVHIRDAIVELFVRRAECSDGISVASFNDHPDTTHEDVLKVLARARELEIAAS